MNFKCYEPLFVEMELSTKLLYKIVNSAKAYRWHMDDYVVECILFIYENMKKYDVNKGASRDTYAYYAHKLFSFNWAEKMKKTKLFLFSELKKESDEDDLVDFLDVTDDIDETKDALEQARELVQKYYGKIGEQVFSFLSGEENVFDELAQRKGKRKATKVFIRSMVPSYDAVEKGVRKLVESFCTQNHII